MNVYHYVYTRPLGIIVLWMALAALGWTLLGRRMRRGWMALNGVLLVVALTAILRSTLLSRSTGHYDIQLRPLTSLAAARQQPEVYRSMLMNVFLFFPLGLSLSSLLPRRWRPGLRIALTAAAGLLLSTAVEYSQYRWHLGIAETDDVLCNALGALLGAAALALPRISLRKAEPIMTTLTTTQQQLISLLRAAIAGEVFPPEPTDWAALLALAQQQKLLPLIFSAAQGMQEAPSLFAEARQLVISQVLTQTRRSAEFAALYRGLRAAGLHPLVVKGQLCSRLYPLQDHRISGDDDLLVSEAEFLPCHAALLAAGLQADHPEDELAGADEVTYTKPGSPLRIELHRRLFDPRDDLEHFFVDIPPVEIDGFLTLPPHEHLLYLILHAYKHFTGSGIGLRQFCDIALWAQACHQEIDWPLLYRQCAAVRAAVFASAVFAIGQDRLGIDFSLPAPWGSAPDPEPLLRDALCGGIYGSNDLTRLHSSTLTRDALRADRVGRSATPLAALFPGRPYMQRQYPYVKRTPLLLPVAWAHRLVRYLHEQRTTPDNSPAASLQLGKERIELLRRYDVID